MKTKRLAIAIATAALATFLAGGQAAADVPGTIALQGTLMSAAGGPAADGDYQVTFAIFAAKTGGSALWSEPQTVKVAKGVFRHVLGSLKAFPAGLFATKGGTWLSIKVGNDPEMARKAIHAVSYARRAAVAEGLACTGCVPLSALKPGGDLDLGGGALKAKKVAASQVVATSIAASTFQGDGSKLTGIKVPAGTCKVAGEVVKGIKPDGTLDCIKAMDPSALPPDGLDEISNGLLTNQYIDETWGKKKVGIADNNPTGISDELVFPDIGVAQQLDVLVDLSNSDISTVTVWLFDPNNVKYVLYAKGGKGTSLKGTWPSKDKTVSGDLTKWLNKNPKGKWRLQVIDTGFKNNGQDGQINSWSVRIKTLSSKKVSAKGVLEAKNGLRLQIADKHPQTCNAANAGYIYYNTKDKNLYVCDGKAFDLAVKAPLGSENKPAKSCQAILNAGDSKGSGVYWLDPDTSGGSAPKFQAWCDMVREGGGWMLVFNLDTNDGGLRSWFDTNFWLTNNEYGNVTAPLGTDFKSGKGYAGAPVTDILIVAHSEGNDYKGKATWARYALNSSYKGKTFKAIMASGSNKTIATVAKKTGNIAKNAYTRNAGDVFIDHGLPIIINSTGKAGTDADNRVRIGTDFKPLCGHVSCNGHNVQGGYGGYHDRGNSYPLTYEAMPSFGYHPGPMGFGNDWKNNNGCGNSVWSNKCNPESAILQVDFAIYIR